MSFSERAAQVWCLAMARTHEVQHIDRDGLPYLERYFLAGWSPTNRRSGPAVFLHHFVASDSTEKLHSHPWGWSCSLILVGGYSEQRCKQGGGTMDTAEYKPGAVNVLEANDKHRIDLLASDCWTLFLAGNFEKSWEFAPRC